MNNIKELIKDLKSNDFLMALEEVYNFNSADKETPNVKFEEFTSAIRALFVDEYITARDDDELKNILYAAEYSDIYAVDADSMYKLLETANSKIGEVIAKDYFKETMYILDNRFDSMYEDLSNYNNVIANYIKNEYCYFTIKQIKMGNYTRPVDYSISQKEMRALENVKFLGPVNRLIHSIYDVDGIPWKYCEYDKIPKDSILNRFAIHTNKENPLFKIIFEDGTIVEYILGDFRVLPYKFQDILQIAKCLIVEELKENDISYIEKIDKSELGEEIKNKSNRAISLLNLLREVYTKKMIDTANRKVEDIKQLVKEYKL